MDMTKMMSNLRLNLVLLGKPGVGKSASGNTILGREAFPLEKSSMSATQDFPGEVSDFCKLPITVYDTPGFSGAESEEELRKYEELLKKCESGLCAFLMVLQCDRFTEEDQETVEKIEKLLKEKRMQNVWILFTGEDRLKDENKSTKRLIEESEALKSLIQKYEGRSHYFNNKTNEPGDQVNSLISKVFTRNLENLPKKPQQRIRINIQDIPVDKRLSRQIVLLGKSGVGKSAAGNTILGQKEFTSMRSSNSVTNKCSKQCATVLDRSVSVVDTPGFFDTSIKTEDLITEVARSVYISSPGPHAFLIVLRVIDRFTDQEQQIPQIIEFLFGQEVLKYSIILFTNGDQLEDETIEDLVDKNSKLKDLVDQCGGRYHVFNNKDPNNREQVNDLLQKIDTMIEQNGGGHYSNQMYEDALRFRREEEEQRQREEERIKREEEQRKQDENKREEQEIETAVRAKIEAELPRKETSQDGFLNFISQYKSYFQMAAFVVGGITVGALVLPGVGAAVGAGVGAGVGAVVTAVSGGGATVIGSVAGATFSACVGATAGGAAASGAVASGAVASGAAASGAAASGAVASGAAASGAAASGAAASGAAASGTLIGAGVGAVTGAVTGAVGGVVVGVRAGEKNS